MCWLLRAWAESKARAEAIGPGLLPAVISGVNQSLFGIAAVCTRDQSASELLYDPLTKACWMLLSCKHRHDSDPFWKETNLSDEFFLTRKSRKAKSSEKTRRVSSVTSYHFLLVFYPHFIMGFLQNKDAMEVILFPLPLNCLEPFHGVHLSCFRRLGRMTLNRHERKVGT